MPPEPLDVEKLYAEKDVENPEATFDFETQLAGIEAAAAELDARGPLARRRQD
jgi:hypothetical protein